MYFGIDSSVNWVSVEPVSKGWSSDKKYFVKTGTGEDFLLRLSDIEQYDAKKKEYEIITKYSKLGIKCLCLLSLGYVTRVKMYTCCSAG